MDKKKAKKNKTAHATAHANTRFIVINNMAKPYSEPKLHIPKDKDGKPTVAPNKPWYVYYYYDHPITKTRRSPIQLKLGINRLKTARERKDFGEQIIDNLKELLKGGYSPYEDTGFNMAFNKDSYTIVEALRYALTEKKPEYRESTFADTENRINTFIKWLERLHLDFELVENINKKHIVAFLNELAKTVSMRTVNNYKTAISAMFTKLVDDDIIKTNVVLSVKKKKTTPKMNKPFTAAQLKRIKAYLMEHDPYLYRYICFVSYAYLRPREVCRLKVENVDLDNGLIHVVTKQSDGETLRIIQTLKPIAEAMQLDGQNPEHHVFTPQERPDLWNAKESSKVTYFSDRFAKLKKALGLGKYYTVYSFRHTVSINIYNHFTQTEGLTEREAVLKMLPITRHKSEASLRNYLRDVAAFLPKDYSDKITIDF